MPSSGEEMVYVMEVSLVMASSLDEAVLVSTTVLVPDPVTVTTAVIVFTTGAVRSVVSAGAARASAARKRAKSGKCILE